MRALTLWQPYATLVAAGLKRVETRSWKTDHHGPLLIHAAAKQDDETRRLSRMVNGILVTHGHLELPDVLPCGAALAVCVLVDVRRVPSGGLTPTGMVLSSLEMAFGDYRPGRYGWKLENIRPLAGPISCHGTQGLWTVSEELERLVRVQFAGEEVTSG